jgi:hypothetical protein
VTATTFDQRAEQLEFDIWPLVPAVGKTIDERFASFHHANGWVFRALELMTGDLVAGGQRRVGMKMLIEVLRYRYFRQTFDPSSPFRLNNDYTSRYTRLLVAAHPEWADVFETRELRS